MRSDYAQAFGFIAESMDKDVSGRCRLKLAMAQLPEKDFLYFYVVKTRLPTGVCRQGHLGKICISCWTDLLQMIVKVVNFDDFTVTLGKLGKK